MRNKYKYKQLCLQESKKEQIINDKENKIIHPKLNIQNNQNNTNLNSSKSIGKFHKIISFNASQKESKNTRSTNKNSPSISLRKEMQNYNTSFNKNLYEKNNKSNNFNKTNEKKQDENNNQTIIKKIKYNSIKDNKNDIIVSKTNRDNNNENILEKYPLTNNNSHNFNS